MIIHVKTRQSFGNEGCSSGSQANVSSAEQRRKRDTQKKRQETTCMLIEGPDINTRPRPRVL
jgi:hypothetical protein